MSLSPIVSRERDVLLQEYHQKIQELERECTRFYQLVKPWLTLREFSRPLEGVTLQVQEEKDYLPLISTLNDWEKKLQTCPMDSMLCSQQAVVEQALYFCAVMSLGFKKYQKERHGMTYSCRNQEGVIQGLMHVLTSGQALHIQWMLTHPHTLLHRQEAPGAGRCLIQYAESYARSNGLQAIQLQSVESALFFYIKVGFLPELEGINQYTRVLGKLIKRVS